MREEERESYRFLNALVRISGESGGGLASGCGEAELVHHPVGFGAFSSRANVVDERLLEADALMIIGSSSRGGGIDGSVNPRGLPETGACHPVRPYAVPVLPSPHAEEVPFFLPHCAYLFSPRIVNSNQNMKIL